MNTDDKKIKVVFSDNGFEKGIRGTILSEDEFFITLMTEDGKEYRIGKRAIIFMKEVSQ